MWLICQGIEIVDRDTTRYPVGVEDSTLARDQFILVWDLFLEILEKGMTTVTEPIQVVTLGQGSPDMNLAEKNIDRLTEVQEEKGHTKGMREKETPGTVKEMTAENVPDIDIDPLSVIFFSEILQLEGRKAAHFSLGRSHGLFLTQKPQTDILAFTETNFSFKKNGCLREKIFTEKCFLGFY
eukprot:TRINITY_DN2417_c0_g2_i6.p1 TRINITY_DN2417_c0_g2~~TRINITY_DN2417_c0_g2_i6.p1  ORF type:complete len:182 (+),score=35.15 TRINITY_DN2417_c0_g2_i6:106-651(+)